MFRLLEARCFVFVSEILTGGSEQKNMPSNQILEKKQQIVAELADKLQNSVAGVIVEYKGITVEADTKLRKELRAAGVEYRVVKNTLLSRAAEKAGLMGFDDVLHGTTALAISDDHTSAAKILNGYIEKSKSKTFKIKSGYVEGKVVSGSEVIALAHLPSKEVLVAQVLGGLNAPIAGLAGVCSGLQRGLVVALNAIAEKQSA